MLAEWGGSKRNNGFNFVAHAFSLAPLCAKHEQPWVGIVLFGAALAAVVNLHPSFIDLIDFYVQHATPHTPQHKLRMHFAVIYAIPFTTAAVLNAAIPLIYPDSVR